MTRCPLIGLIALMAVTPAFAQNHATPARAAALEQLTTAQPMLAVQLDGARISRLYGAPLTYGVTAEHAAAAFVNDHAAIFDLPAEDFVPKSRGSQPTMYNAATDTYKFTLVSYAQQRDGLPVYGADLRLLVLNESDHPLVWVGSNVRELGNFHVSPAIVANANEIEAQATALGAVPSLVNFEPTELVIWAGTLKPSAVPSVAFVFTADNYGSPDAEKPERWRFVIDAADYQILDQESLIRFTNISGSVAAMASDGPKSDNCSTEVPMPMPFARVQVAGGSSVYADANGNFSIPNGGTSAVNVQSFMNGQYFTVDNYAGSEETLTLGVTPPGPANFMHNAANTSEAIRAQVNAYVQAHIVRDWVLTYDPTFPQISTETGFPMYVNRTDYYCPGNAWSDGASINFCSSSGSYPNTAWSSVIHHEYGHHVVDCGGSGQSEYGEGIADAHAVLIADDPVLGYGFYGDCDSGLRNADNNCQYLSYGCSTCGSESHDCGQLLVGTIWSIREYLAATEPVDGLAIISNIVVNSIQMHSGSSIQNDILIDFLTLDDTDGYIYNGTPHWDEICAGFADHGFTCPELQAGLSVTPGDGFASAGDYGGPFTPPTKDYTLYNIGTYAVDYSVTCDAPWITLTNASGTIPGKGTIVVTAALNANAEVLGMGPHAGTLQFVNLTDGAGDTARDVSIQIGVPSLVYDFPLGTDPGWTTEGQWAYGLPLGGGGASHGPADPTSGYTGTNVYGYNLGGDYAPLLPIQSLVTTALDCSGATNVAVKFWRWLGVEKSTYDHATVGVSNDGTNWTTVWSNVAAVEDAGWVAQEYDLSAVADNQPTVYVRWTMGPTDGSWQFCGWNIDDIQIWGVVAPTSCRGDCNCDGHVDYADINGFVDALTKSTYCDGDGGNTDINGDGSMDFSDINPFVNLLTTHTLPIACP